MSMDIMEFPSAGKAVRKACGSAMCHIIFGEGHSHAVTCLDLAHGYAFERAADGLGHVGSFIEAQDNHGGYEGRELDSDARKTEEHDVELDKKRRSAGHPDVESADPLKTSDLGILNQCHKKGNRKGYGK